MALESPVTHIGDLNENWPTGPTDSRREGDDHVRNIKKALKNSFGVGHDNDSGDHTVLTLSEQSTPTPEADKLQVYARAVGSSTGLFVQDENGLETPLTLIHVAKSTSFTVGATENGVLFVCNPKAAGFDATLPSSPTTGFEVGFLKNSSPLPVEDPLNQVWVKDSSGNIVECLGLQDDFCVVMWNGARWVRKKPVQHYCYLTVGSSGAYALSAGVWTKLDLDTAGAHSDVGYDDLPGDPYGMFDAVNKRAVCKVPGVYQIFATFRTAFQWDFLDLIFRRDDDASDLYEMVEYFTSFISNSANPSWVAGQATLAKMVEDEYIDGLVYSLSGETLTDGMYKMVEVV